MKNIGSLGISNYVSYASSKKTKKEMVLLESAGTISKFLHRLGTNAIQVNKKTIFRPILKNKDILCMKNDESRMFSILEFVLKKHNIYMHALRGENLQDSGKKKAVANQLVGCNLI